MSGISCDWLTVSEVHTKESPRGADRFRLNLESGELEPNGVEPVQLQGLNGSSARVYSDGTVVQFSGNPSRWNRSEAVFGLSVDEAKARVNSILVEHGYRPFTERAVVSRIDLCRNLACGHLLAQAQRILASVRYGRLGVSTVGDNVYWGAGSTHRQLRAYAKGPEVRTHASAHEGAERDYLIRLADWLCYRGALRVELELGRHLNRIGGARWGSLTQRDLASLYEKEVSFMAKIKRSDLQEMEELPNRLLGVLMMHLAGVDVRSRMHEETFRRYRNALSDYGYDISVPVAKPFTPKSVRIEMEPLTVPDFAVSRLPQAGKLAAVE